MHFHPLVWSKASKKEEVLLEETQRAAQLLFNKLRTLPTEMSETGPVTILPTETSSLPRFKKIPEPKPETKWEKFAREKGIKNSKRDRMVYDEVTGEFAPRFGYKRSKNGLQDQAIVEIKPGDDPYADPWAEDRKQKKARVEKNEKQKQQNQSRALKAKGKNSGVSSYSPEAVPGIPLELTGKQEKRGKGGVKNALKLAQLSTASMGRFDNYRTGEPERKLSGNKRKFRDNFEALNSEKDSMKAQIRFVEDKKSKREKGVTNSLSAYEGILPDAPSFSFNKGKGKGKGAGSVDKKKRKK
jgi:regulator of ribosome biosynthesis